MSISKPSELRRFLDSLGIRAKKGLSQNFLIDQNILRKILTTANVQEGDVILEIGPGPGALTEFLLEAKAQVIAVEKDPVYATALERFKEKNGHLKIVEGDILEFPFQEELKPYLESGRKAKVVANLPYHVTTPIVTRMVTENALFSTMTIMVQDEVARRMTSGPGSKVYSSLSVFLRFFCEPTYAFFVSRNCFYPKPKVDSAVVHLVLKAAPPVSSPENLLALVRVAFQQRRKKMRNSLSALYAPAAVEEALERAGLNRDARPEDLSLEQFIILYQNLKIA